MNTPKSQTGKDNLNQQALEDYLKTIFLLGEMESPVSTSRIAESRQVTPASVTSMIQRLDTLGFVHYKKHHGVTLTEEGRKVALEMLRHHRLIELYLMKALDFTWDEVHEQAEILEHVISEELEERMAAALGHPTVGVYGQPIPTYEGEIVAVPTEPLTSLPIGIEATVAHITDDTNRELLTYLADLGIVPGTRIRLLEKAPYEGPLTIEINDKHCYIGYKAANVIYVKKQLEDN